MSKEELLKDIMKLPKVEKNNPISTMNSINVDDLINAVDRLNKIPDYNDLLKENQQLKESIEHLKKENKKQKNILDEIYNHCESRINVCKSLQSDDEWECCIAELDGVISILKEVE